MATRGNALILMAKAPEPGQVKTRIAPPLSLEEAAELAHGLLSDQLENLRHFDDAALFVAFTPEQSANFFEDLVPRNFSSFPQQGDSLGERMTHAFNAVFGQNFRNVLLIGGDLPPVPLKFFHRAYAVLERVEVVLGPSLDGGYYLVGMNRPFPEIFEGITWSRDDVLAKTLEKLEQLKLRYELLPEWVDIDTCEDLRRLLSLNDPWLQNSMRNTARMLRRLKAKGTI